MVTGKAEIRHESRKPGGPAHRLGATGPTAEAAAQAICKLPEITLLGPSGGAGGVPEYPRAHPVGKLTVAAGFAMPARPARGAPVEVEAVATGRMGKFHARTDFS